MKKLTAFALILALCLISLPAAAEYYSYQIPLDTLQMDIVVPEDFFPIVPEMLEDEQFMADMGEMAPYLTDCFSDPTLKAYFMAYESEYDIFVFEMEGSLNIDSLTDSALGITEGIMDFFSLFTSEDVPSDYEIYENLSHKFMKMTFEEGYTNYLTSVADRTVLIMILPLSESGEISPSQQMILTNIFDSIYIHE